MPHLSQELHLWDLETLQLVRKYSGHAQARFAIRACFGGPGDGCVASGSEDGCVYIWTRHQDRVLQTLSGHDGAVNCVSWSPSGGGDVMSARACIEAVVADMALLASGGDDGTVRLWGPPLRATPVQQSDV